MNNILVVNGYVRQNKGDAVLMSVLCQELQAAFPQAVIRISSQEDPSEYASFEQWQNVGSFIQYCFDPHTGKLHHLLRMLLCVGSIELFCWLPGGFRMVLSSLLPTGLKAQFTAIGEADLVVSMGGGYLNGNASMMANACVYLMLAPLRLGKRFGACAVCAPQSMGPFGTGFQKAVVRGTLEKVDLLLTREKKTVKLLAELSNHFPVVQSVDSGFLFSVHAASGVRKKWKVGRGELLVGITVRQWLDPKRQGAYETAVAKAVDYITGKYGARVVFIPQVTSELGGDDDRITSQRVYDRLTNKKPVSVLKQDYTHQEIKAIYNELDFIIGTRFHSVIFSLTSYVPALAIEYEHKTSGIMHDLALDKWVVKIEDVTAEILEEKIDKLVVARDEYKRHLRAVLPSYLLRAKEATTLIRRAYETSRVPLQEQVLPLPHDHVVEVDD